MASTLVKSLKRLYTAGKITIEDVAERVASGTISEEEYETITGEAYAAAS